MTAVGLGGIFGSDSATLGYDESGDFAIAGAMMLGFLYGSGGDLLLDPDIFPISNNSVITHPFKKMMDKYYGESGTFDDTTLKEHLYWNDENQWVFGTSTANLSGDLTLGNWECDESRCSVSGTFSGSAEIYDVYDWDFADRNISFFLDTTQITISNELGMNLQEAGWATPFAVRGNYEDITLDFLYTTSKKD